MKKNHIQVTQTKVLLMKYYKKPNLKKLQHYIGYLFLN